MIRKEEKEYEYLGLPARLIWTILLTILGIIPATFIFFFWVMTNCKYGYLIQFKWFTYQVKEVSSSLVDDVLWNSVWFFTFGIMHSVLAQNFAQIFLRKIFPVQTIRALYNIHTGISLLLMIANWRTHDVYLWKFGLLGDHIDPYVNYGVFCFFISLNTLIFARFGIFETFGYKQLWLPESALSRTNSMPKLVTNSFYSLVRHPIYFFTLMGFILTTAMSLDRMTLILLILIDYKFAIPVEEEKLRDIFKTSYIEYSKNTPALIPTMNSFYNFVKELSV